MGMAVAIGVAAAVNNHGIVQQGVAVQVLYELHFFQEFRKLLNIEQINIGDFFDFLRIVLMM